MIFSRKQLRVVKMSNRRLMIGVSTLILLELVLLIVWSQVSPLKPITYIRNVSGSFHEATHCSVDGEGMIFVVIETVYKACILLAGTMLAFSTRKVSNAFNESSAIAWSIYNVLFSSIIFGGIVYFVSAFEDTLILLFTFLIGWVTFVTWCLLFGAKFYTLFSKSETEAAQMSRIDSLQTEKSQGFSFVSVAAMPVNLIKSYIGALEGQLAKARKELSIKLGTKGQGIGVSPGTNRVRPLSIDAGADGGDGGTTSGFHASCVSSRVSMYEDGIEEDVLNQPRSPPAHPDPLTAVSPSQKYLHSKNFTHFPSGASPSWTDNSSPANGGNFKVKPTSPTIVKRPVMLHAHSSTTTPHYLTRPTSPTSARTVIDAPTPSATPPIAAAAAEVAVASVPSPPDVRSPSLPSSPSASSADSTMIDAASQPVSPRTQSVGTITPAQPNVLALSTAAKPSSRVTHTKLSSRPYKNK